MRNVEARKGVSDRVRPSLFSVVVVVVGERVPGRNGERIWDTGAGIILRLGTCSPGGQIWSDPTVCRSQRW